MKYVTGAVRILGHGMPYSLVIHRCTCSIHIQMVAFVHVLPSGFLHSFSCGNDNNKLYLWPYPEEFCRIEQSRQSFNPSLWTCHYSSSAGWRWHFYDIWGPCVEYLIIVITSFLLHVNNVYILCTLLVALSFC